MYNAAATTQGSKHMLPPCQGSKHTLPPCYSTSRAHRKGRIADQHIINNEMEKRGDTYAVEDDEKSQERDVEPADPHAVPAADPVTVRVRVRGRGRDVAPADPHVVPAAEGIRVY